MTILSSDAIEVINHEALVTVALNQGYNAFHPVYDNGIDLILHGQRLRPRLEFAVRSRPAYTERTFLQRPRPRRNTATALLSDRIRRS